MNATIPQGFIFGGFFKGWEEVYLTGSGNLEKVYGQAVHLVHADPAYPGTFFLDTERFGQCAVPATFEETGKPVLFWADGSVDARLPLGKWADTVEIESRSFLEYENVHL